MASAAVIVLTAGISPRELLMEKCYCSDISVGLWIGCADTLVSDPAASPGRQMSKSLRSLQGIQISWILLPCSGKSRAVTLLGREGETDKSLEHVTFGFDVGFEPFYV